MADNIEHRPLFRYGAVLHLGILLIELGVGITVTGVLLSIFFAFASRKHF